MRKLFKPFYYTHNIGRVIFTIILSISIGSLILGIVTINPAWFTAFVIWGLIYFMLTGECYAEAPTPEKMNRVYGQKYVLERTK